MADHGDEIREYIQQLASASAANNATDTAANVQTTNKLTTMEVEIKKLTATIASMANKLNSNPNPNPNGKNINPNSGEIEGIQKNPYKKLRNMGGYCNSHGFHPVGIKHYSATCIYKKPVHKSEATWCNRLDGNMSWPSAKRVTVEQQEHPSWKGKMAPTN